jgi:hypothetical protein
MMSERALVEAIFNTALRGTAGDTAARREGLWTALQNFLEFKSYMSKRNHQRIKARLRAAPKQELKSKRLAHHSIQIPFSNYSTRGAMHWR